jgi:hypothetical protein
VGTKDADFNGIYIHFYAYGTSDLPGELQAEFFHSKATRASLTL